MCSYISWVFVLSFCCSFPCHLFLLFFTSPHLCAPISDIFIHVGEKVDEVISPDDFRSNDESATFITITSSPPVEQAGLYNFTTKKIPPSEVGFLPVQGCVRSIQFSGDYLFVVAQRVYNYDVHEPRLPEISFITSGGCRPILHATVEGNFMYLSCGGKRGFEEGGLILMDISNRTSPVIITDSALDVPNITSAFVREGLAYCGSGEGGGKVVGGVVETVHNTAIWFKTGKGKLTAPPYRLFNHKSLIYGAYGGGGPFLFDITHSNLAGQDPIRRYIFDAYAIYANDEFCVFTDRKYGIRVFDPYLTSPLHADSELPLSGTSRGLAVSSKVAFIASETYGVRMVDLDDPSHPELMFNVSYPNASASEIVVGYNYFYVGECPSVSGGVDQVGENGVRIFHFGDLRFETGVFEHCGDFKFDVAVRSGSGTTMESFFIHVRKPGFFDSECTVFKCFDGLLSNDTDNTCNGHGVCLPEKTECLCRFGYSGAKCEVFDCFGPSGAIPNTNPEVCWGHGVCVDRFRCECETNYTIRQDCSVCECFGVPSDLDTVCGGHGECVSPDVCNCDEYFVGKVCGECATGFTGSSCDFNIVVFSTVGGSIFLLVFLCCFCCLAVAMLIFVVIGLLVVFLFCCCCFALCVLCSCSCMLFCCVSGLGCFSGFQKLRLQRYGKLKDFDILLQEQLLEGRTSIAHLRINKSLFEIPYEEIETKSVLGEGGSNAVVFLAVWKQQQIAFKCFKTKRLCESQSAFDEFEREVNLLASLNHPNIIRFFGATLRPPRVGILMEYCENGELLEFVENYRTEKNNKYPLSEKLRMLKEICSSMDFVHSRNIIHRDLKPQNVLVDANETSKLMDFGLSRTVNSIEDSLEKTKRVGTNLYMAPEVVSGVYDSSCDVFSFAVLSYTFLTERTPYGDCSFNVELRVASDPNFRPELKFLESVVGKNEEFDWVVEMLVNCWKHDASSRFSFQQLGQIFTENGFNEKKSNRGFKNKARTTSSSKVIKEKQQEIKSLGMVGVFSEEPPVVGEEYSTEGKDTNSTLLLRRGKKPPPSRRPPPIPSRPRKSNKK